MLSLIHLVTLLLVKIIDMLRNVLDYEDDDVFQPKTKTKKEAMKIFIRSYYALCCSTLKQLLHRGKNLYYVIWEMKMPLEIFIQFIPQKLIYNPTVGQIIHVTEIIPYNKYLSMTRLPAQDFRHLGKF